MSGKCRASLRAKTLENVKRSLLSKADKNCIAEVFARFEKAHSEIDRLTEIEEAHREQNGELRKEVERLQKYNTNIARKHYQDGVKDLFERLKERYWNIPMWGKVAVVFMEEIAKEMGVEL